jgi:hypothetical protein
MMAGKGISMNQIRIDMRSYRWTGYACFIIFTLCSIFALISGEYVVLLEFAFFSFIGLYFALCSGVYVIDADNLLLNSVAGQWRISWNEISAAQFSGMGSLLLLSRNKRFVLAPPSWWPRACRAEGRRFVSEQLMARNIASTPSATADFKWMKNTKIKSYQRRSGSS